MTLPDPTDVIAPRDEHGFQSVDFLQEMFTGAYGYLAIVQYYGFKLECHHYEEGPRVWNVYTADEEQYIETLNLEAFRTVTDLEAFLDELVDVDPDDREEWVSQR